MQLASRTTQQGVTVKRLRWTTPSGEKPLGDRPSQLVNYCLTPLIIADRAVGKRGQGPFEAAIGVCVDLLELALVDLDAQPRSFRRRDVPVVEDLEALARDAGGHDVAVEV